MSVERKQSSRSCMTEETRSRSAEHVPFAHQSVPLSDFIQVFDNHQPVSPEEYTGKNVRLPSPNEIPHIDLQVVNYHRPIFGTFHSKFMVVDRRIAILSSNNIQVYSSLLSTGASPGSSG